MVRLDISILFLHSLQPPENEKRIFDVEYRIKCFINGQLNTSFSLIFPK